MNKNIKLSTILLCLLLTFTLYAEMEDDDAEDLLEEVKDKFIWLAKKSKYKNFVLYKDVKPIQDLYKAALFQLKEEGNYEASVYLSTKALAKIEIAEDTGRIRFYQNGIDLFYLNKFQDLINKQELKSLGFKKKGIEYVGLIREKKIFQYERYRWTENISPQGHNMLEKLVTMTKKNKKISIKIKYGHSRDYRSPEISKQRSDVLAKYLFSKLNASKKQVSSEGVGRKVRGDTIKITVKGVP